MKKISVQYTKNYFFFLDTKKRGLLRKHIPLVGCLFFIGLQTSSMAKSGPYAGLGVSYIQPSSKKTTLHIVDSVGGLEGFFAATLQSTGSRQFGGGVFGGYHYNPDSLGDCFLEGEVAARLSNTELQRAVGTTVTPGPINTTFALSIKQKESLIFLVRAGKGITLDTRLYLSLGISRAAFRTSIEGIAYGDVAPGQFLSPQKTNHLRGIHFGFGMAHDLDDKKKMSLRLDYEHAVYQKYRKEFTYYEDTGNNIAELYFAPSLSGHMVSCAFVYKLN